MARILLNTVALDPLRWATPRRRLFDLKELIPAVASHTGFKALEIWQYHLTSLSSGEIDRLRLQLDDAGLSAPVVGLYPALAGPSADASLSESREIMEAARELGAYSVKIFVGELATETISDDDWKQSLKNLDVMIRNAAALELEINGETHMNTLFDDILSVEHTMAAIGEGRIGICFQPYDFSDSFGTIELVRKLARDIRHLHFQGRTSAGDFCLIEHAPIDYRRLLGVLARAGFDGLMSIEFVKDCVVDSPDAFDLNRVLANAETDRAYLSRIAMEAGLEVS